MTAIPQGLYVHITDEKGVFHALLFQMEPPGKWMLRGAAFSCRRFIPWASGGLYDDVDFRDKKINGPSEFDVWVGTAGDFARKTIRFWGVVWTKIEHDNPTDSVCGGIAEFTCEGHEVR